MQPIRFDLGGLNTEPAERYALSDGARVVFLELVGVPLFRGTSQFPLIDLAIVILISPAFFFSPFIARPTKKIGKGEFYKTS